MEKVVEEEYPEFDRDGYDETADAFRDEFGEYAGYAQNYLFHHARNRE